MWYFNVKFLINNYLNDVNKRRLLNHFFSSQSKSSNDILR